MRSLLFLFFVYFISASACNSERENARDFENDLYKLSYLMPETSNILKIFRVLFEELSSGKIDGTELKNRFYFLSQSYDSELKEVALRDELYKFYKERIFFVPKYVIEQRAKKYIFIEDKSENILLSAGFAAEMFTNDEGLFTEFYVLPNAIILYSE